MLRPTVPDPDAWTYTEHYEHKLRSEIRYVFTLENPTPAQRRELATLFHDYVSWCLKEVGYEGSKSSVARLLGETYANYQRALTTGSFRLDRFCRWLVTWQIAVQHGVVLPSHKAFPGLISPYSFSEAMMPSGSAPERPPEPEANVEELRVRLAAFGIKMVDNPLAPKG